MRIDVAGGRTTLQSSSLRTSEDIAAVDATAITAIVSNDPAWSANAVFFSIFMFEVMEAKAYIAAGYPTLDAAVYPWIAAAVAADPTLWTTGATRADWLIFKWDSVKATVCAAEATRAKAHNDAEYGFI